MSSQTIWCIGRNYADHAKELGNQVPKQPLIFMKSPNCLTQNSSIQLPRWSKEIHYEGELVIRLGSNYEVTHYALGIDLTARDLQTQAKQKGHPWALAKSFKDACPISKWIEVKNQSQFDHFNFQVYLNGSQVQQGLIDKMLFPIPKIIDYLNQHFPLTPGDLIMTGTPEGVGALSPGDRMSLCDNLGLKVDFEFI